MVLRHSHIQLSSHPGFYRDERPAALGAPASTTDRQFIAIVSLPFFQFMNVETNANITAHWYTTKIYDRICVGGMSTETPEYLLD